MEHAQHHVYVRYHVHVERPWFIHTSACEEKPWGTPRAPRTSQVALPPPSAPRAPQATPTEPPGPRDPQSFFACISTERCIFGDPHSPWRNPRCPQPELAVHNMCSHTPTPEIFAKPTDSNHQVSANEWRSPRGGPRRPKDPTGTSQERSGSSGNIPGTPKAPPAPVRSFPTLEM